ncbi:hypothetical protein LOTGIDRAFT_132678 [Lottia gigantea]|uniref:EGF-like domain-containing protein n=1 Tax=Lottia gigantea TaxID=225164 RepID=V4B5T9_LOTGI|nr:hypothetical protein LOTGIDRAFT_132678 [Lottia gigantea]ESO83874.1 hypothetical protein LOTGIDRAFT_132678 [Lottia gigantea]
MTIGFCLFSADLDGNDCISLPCQNGGTCQDGINTYTCLCPHNFNGTNCQTDLSKLYIFSYN